MLALKIGGWTNVVLATSHMIVLGWAWTIFRWVDIEPEMRDLADQHAALPYVLTLVAAAFFLAFGLYALSAAGTLRRLPLVRPMIALIAVIYLLRATLFGGIADVVAGDVKQTAFAAIALLIGLCYAWGAVMLRRRHRARGSEHGRLEVAQRQTRRFSST